MTTCFGRDACYDHWFAPNLLNCMVLPTLDWKSTSKWSDIISLIVDQCHILILAMYCHVWGRPNVHFYMWLIHTSWSLQTKPMLLLSTSSLYWPGLPFKWLCLTMCLDHAHKHFKVSLRWLSEDKHRIWRFQFICNI